MSEENNWNYGNDEPNVNQGNPVSLEKSTTDGTAGVNLEKTVTGNEERVNPEKTMTDNPYYTNTSYGNGNTNYNYGQSNDSAGYNYGQSNGSTDYNYGQPNGNNQSESEGFGIASLILGIITVLLFCTCTAGSRYPCNHFRYFTAGKRKQKRNGDRWFDHRWNRFYSIDYSVYPDFFYRTWIL